MRPDWIGLDWGTSTLRAWAMAADGTVLAEAQSGDGMGGLAPEAFETALLALIDPWLGPRDGAPVPVLACGMVGARQGWTEAAYRALPCTPVGPPLTPAPCRDPRIAVRIVPGLSQTRPGPDVMRGEETQLAGLLHLRPGFDGVACLPGTHTKWAALSAGEVTSFQTAMTGELFALLSKQSVLRHSLGADPAAFDDAAFDEAVSDTLSRPESLAARLFAIRAADLTQGQSAATARGRLSGLLIGAELAATKPWWLGRAVVLVGAPALSALYARALAVQGITAETLDATQLVLAGLTAARNTETTT
ncbi:2-dehydro-3-deoxygalactonokinase [Frigidibacter sp. ROC022]|uniref:2-dehydro-3-deoxygalactonokinase n=1 Tax=Frigidibacter sp. ROC022 TaxID=2971796 RepID=UPI00215B1B45|nr:2-dehydro-3-deoxygalactonokinase [Frigidibacter sp. ROC022]MCR8726697.1 2-dehydro-3-deoxygalactonokinase [Frigidibacter sp. ROC022]